jgi:hypothetical protein
MKTLHTQIDIDAPAERVWDILTNIADYSIWNRFIPHLAGTLASGERLEVRIEPPGGAAMTFRPTVLGSPPGDEVTRDHPPLSATPRHEADVIEDRTLVGARPAERFGRRQEWLQDGPLCLTPVCWMGDTRHAPRCTDGDYAFLTRPLRGRFGRCSVAGHATVRVRRGASGK